MSGLCEGAAVGICTDSQASSGQQETVDQHRTRSFERPLLS